MPFFAYEFGGNRTRRYRATRVSLAIALAVVRYGSDKDLGRVLGVSRNVLARWRAGTVPRPAHRRALAEAAEIPIDWLEAADL